MSVGVRNPHAEVPPLEPGRIDELEEKRESVLGTLGYTRGLAQCPENMVVSQNLFLQLSSPTPGYSRRFLQ